MKGSQFERSLFIVGGKVAETANVKSPAALPSPHQHICAHPGANQSHTHTT